MRKKEFFTPHPGKQTEFLQCAADWVFFGGARGGSKSFSLSWKAALTPVTWHFMYGSNEVSEKEYYDLLAQGKQPQAVVDSIAADYPDYIALLVRRTYPQLERNLKPECDKLYRLYKANWLERNHCYQFPSGAKVYLVHFKDEKAKDNYIGGNYNFLGIDEANQFPEEWVDEIATSVRSDNPLIKPQICLTSNPGNVGHTWLKRKFVDRCSPVPDGEPVYNKEFDVEFQPMKSAKPYYDEEGISFQFIPATVFDNPALLDADKTYVKKLKNLNPTLRAMWLEGKWDVFAGMYFDSWNMLHHTILHSEFKYGIQFSKKTHGLYRFYDYGTKNPFVCLFAAVDSNLNITIFDEITERGLAASRQAEKVNEYAKKKYGLNPEDFDGEICDPAYFTRHSEKDGIPYSPAMFYGDRNIFLTKANNDRLAGAKVVYDAFEIPENGSPRIRFTDNCCECIESIPNLPASEKNPEDVDTNAYDHHYDALRYGAITILSASSRLDKSKTGWRNRIEEKAIDSDSGGSWKSM